MPTICFVLDEASSAEIWAWLSSSKPPSTPSQRYSSQQRSAVQCPAAQLSSAALAQQSGALCFAVLCRRGSSLFMISKTPRTLIFRYLALYSISRYLCVHFVLSKTEQGVVCYFHTRVIKGPRLETRRSKVICPVPSETQSSVGHQLPGV